MKREETIESPLATTVAETGSAAPGNLPGVFIRTFGCQMNEYDTQKLYKILEPRYRQVANPEDASLVVINTCSVRDKPEQKVYSMLGELRELKQQNPGLVIGVGGCVAQQEGDKILKRNKSVDFVFGTHNLSLVPSLIDRRSAGYGPQVAVDYRDEWEDLPLGLSGEGRVSVLVSISRGCNKNCTYCIVPTTRGPEVSRSLQEIEKEIRIAVHRGAREVILLGQTVNSYGLDLLPRLKFSDLLKHISEIEGLQRIRFVSPHPQEIKQDFVDLVAENPKVCRHIHMPMQSGSDAILKAMNRNYRSKRYLQIISDLKTRVPDIAITTDIIVGFPGETEEDFQQTMDMLNQVQFDDSYSYMFSPRPGTVAAEQMEDNVTEEEKLSRLKRFQARQAEITAERLKAWIGKEAELLIDRASNSDSKILCGKISQNITLNLDQEYPRLKPGDIVKVKVTDTGKFTLKGRPLEQVQL